MMGFRITKETLFHLLVFVLVVPMSSLIIQTGSPTIRLSYLFLLITYDASVLWNLVFTQVKKRVANKYLVLTEEEFQEWLNSCRPLFLQRFYKKVYAERLSGKGE